MVGGIQGRVRFTRTWPLWLAGGVLWLASGAACPRGMTGMVPQAPIVLPPQPTAAQLVQTVNRTGEQVTQLQSVGARLAIPGMLGTLEADLAWDRPRRLRFQARHPLSGPELDLGSNDNMYWMWLKREQPATVYFGRHDVPAHAQFGSFLPVPPQWLVETLGLVSLDPNAIYSSPVRQPNGRWELRTSAMGIYDRLTRVLTIDETRGWIWEQHLYDSRNMLVASAYCTEHRYLESLGVSLPHRVEIQLPAAQVQFAVLVDEWRVNQLSAAGDQLWAMPRLPGHFYRDLSEGPANAAAAGAQRLPMN